MTGLVEGKGNPKEASEKEFYQGKALFLVTQMTPENKTKETKNALEMTSD